jgi:hypothetical protein
MRAMRSSACVLLACVTTVAAALGDGGYFYEEGAATQLAQTRQEVLLAIYEDRMSGAPQVTYVLRTQYAGTPAEFAWVVPVPAMPTDVVAHESTDLFDQLEERTSPRFEIAMSRPTGWGSLLGCGTWDAGGENLDTGGLVEVEASGEAGIFEWVALTSTGSSALLTWLADNGFAVPAEAGDVVDRYVQQERHFLALRISEPDELESGADGEIEIPPIQFTCQTAERFYPMAISQISAADETEVLIYVLADHQAEPVNVPNGLIDPDALVYDPASPSNTNYETVFAQTIADLGGTALITEAAWRESTWSEPPWADARVWGDAPVEALQLEFLTRMRTVMSPDQMDLDFEFQDAAADGYVSRDFYIWADYASVASTASLAALPLAAIMLLGLVRVTLTRPSQRRVPGTHDR